MKMTGFASPDGDKAYFFVGGSYVRYDVEGDRVDDGYPLRIVDHWPGLFESDIDACVPWNDGTVLFFKGDQYARYDWEADRVADGFPRAISDDCVSCSRRPSTRGGCCRAGMPTSSKATST
jgi:Hemopexin